MDEKNDIAIEVITSEIAKVMDKYAFEKDDDKSKKLKEKIKFLKEMKEKIYLNNTLTTEFVLKKYKDGAFNGK